MSNCETHSGKPVLSISVGNSSMMLCEECCHRLFNIVGFMTHSVSRLNIEQMSGTKPRPKAFKYNEGKWKP